MVARNIGTAAKEILLTQVETRGRIAKTEKGLRRRLSRSIKTNLRSGALRKKKSSWRT